MQMKKQIRIWLLALMVPIVSLAFSSCGGEDDEPEVMPSIGLSSPQIVSKKGGSLEFNVYDSNAYTSVESNVSWLDVTFSYRTGRCLVNFQKNSSSETREGQISLKYKGGIVDHLIFRQDPADGGVDDGDTPPEPGDLESPADLELVKEGSKVILKWNKVTNATKYYIFYSNPIGFDSGVFVTLYSTSTTTYTMDCKIAGKWAFKVQAYDGKKYSGYSNTVITEIYQSDIDGGGGGGSGPAKPEIPTGLKARVDGTDVYVSWNESKGASYYRLYYVKPAPYDIESFDNVYSTSTTMNCTVEGTWTIWLEAVGSDYEFSEPSSKVTFRITSSGSGGGGSDTPKQLDTPAGLKLESRASDPYVQLSCNAVPLGYEYQLYRSKSPNSGYTRISASVGTDAIGSIVYFTDQNPLSGTSYYKVKVSALSYLNIKDSDFSDYVRVSR